MNHNIMNKIYHKGWLEGLKQVNREYHQNYVYLGDCWSLIYYPYVVHKSNLWTFLKEDLKRISSRDACLLNKWRVPYNDTHKGIEYIKRYKYIKRYENPFLNKILYEYSLPKKYFYSSGLNNLEGFKDW